MIHRISSFDYLKALCILFVIIVHIDVLLPSSINPFTTLHYEFWAQTCVPIFLIISAYLWSLSINNRQLDTISDWFKIKVFKPKLMRILFPYLLVFVIEVFLILLSVGIEGLQNPIYFIYHLLSGGWGRGNYYVTILIQLLVLFPIVHYFYKKSPVKTSIILVGIQLIFEILTQILTPISPIYYGIYRLCILRYLICIIFGLILYYHKNKINKRVIIASFLIGFIFLFGYYSLDWDFPLFNYWTWSSLPAVFYDFALAIFLLKIFEKLDTKQNFVVKRSLSLLSSVGKASYHIYLFQMLWFGFVIHICYSTVSSICPLIHYAIIITIIISVICCCIGGIFYYQIDKKYLQFRILYK